MSSFKDFSRSSNFPRNCEWNFWKSFIFNSLDIYFSFIKQRTSHCRNIHCCSVPFMRWPCGAWQPVPHGNRCGTCGAQPSGSACGQFRWSSSSWPWWTSCRNGSWPPDIRTGSRCASGCGKKTDRNDDTACGSYCDVFQSWKYPWSFCSLKCQAVSNFECEHFSTTKRKWQTNNFVWRVSIGDLSMLKSRLDLYLFV